PGSPIGRCTRRSAGFTGISSAIPSNLLNLFWKISLYSGFCYVYSGSDSFPQKDVPASIVKNRNDYTATLLLKSDNVKVYNLNVANRAGPVGQAIAAKADGANYGFYACNFTGYQDTLYANQGPSVYAKSYISGTVDFVFGLYAKAWFESCDIVSIGKGCISANGRSNDTNPSDELSDIINPKGWQNWNGDNNTANVYFKEYNNRGAGAATNQRVSFSGALTQPVPITDILGANYKTQWWVDNNFL
ncbi:hypothetical protein PF005_g23156, partial [Phytophthora fragariae]